MEDIPPIHLELFNNPLYTHLQLPIQNGTRTISYSQCGNLTSNKIIVFNTGLLGSSVEGPLFVHETALQANVRFLYLDFPGVGESTPHPDRTIKDWALDMEEFLHQLTMQYEPHEQEEEEAGKNTTDQPKLQIHLMGLSMGAPHIMASYARFLTTTSSSSLSLNISTTVTLAAPWVGDYDTNTFGLRLVQSLVPKFLQNWIPPIGGPFLTLLTNLQSPVIHFVTNETAKQLVQAEQEVLRYSHYQSSHGNQQLLRISLIGNSKERIWDPILEHISNASTTSISAANNATTSNNNNKSQHHPTLRVRVFHGTYDDIVTQEACRKLVGWLREEANCLVDYRVIDGADHATIFTDPQNMAMLLDVG